MEAVERPQHEIRLSPLNQSAGDLAHSSMLHFGTCPEYVALGGWKCELN